MRSKLADAQLRERVELAVDRAMRPSPERAVVVESALTALVGVPGLSATVGAQVRMNRELPSPAERRALRIRSGLLEQQVADIVGVPRMTVEHWELGLRTPARGTTQRVRYLNLLDWMIQETADA